ncbi:MAG: SUMF1/EgtB/PvdO family nonheme iron enzyme [Cyclobacteriaceae bacterium]|jgi:formylglycine-generating enzyme required for sulfatase activity|nr:SUMF1/EgtB/PvdO family nonheme iron enzyme [Cyclobacteriaceae bacterium]
MKRILLIYLMFIGFAASAIPEKIYPKTSILKPVGWYSEQMSEWQNYLLGHATDADGWLNYYAAARFAQSSDQKLEDIVTEIKNTIPNTFEFYLIQGWQEGYTPSGFENLKKAYAVNPDHSGTYGLLMLASEFNFDKQARKEYAKKMHEAGILSTSLLSYSYNVLMSVSTNSILITEGENTTLPLIALQDIWNVRTDVTILNLDMFKYGDYRQAKLKTAGLVLTSLSESDADFRQQVCLSLPTENADHKFYYALTLAKENISTLKDQLYVVGLASQHSSIRIDNIALIKQNLEKEFLLDYLTVDFNGTNPYDAGNVLSANYLVPMLLLYEDYAKNKNTERQEELGELVHRIAANTDKEDLVNNFLKRNDISEIPYFPGTLNAKSTEGHFRPINDKIFAEEAEVTNEQYNGFLAYLNQHGLKELYEKYKFDFSRYEEPALAFMTTYSLPRPDSKKNRHYNYYPAVNISFEAANAYCDWLTQQYNNTVERKYKKVKFRLPTLDEWQIAAASIKNPTSWKLDDQEVEVKITPKGSEFDKNVELKKVTLDDPEILYPWFRYFGLRNSPLNNKDCYLGNFKSEPCGCPGYKGNKPTHNDGFAMMAPTKSYFPNDIGLYDVVGNVAEMIDEKGKACGGSWNQPPSESTMRSVRTYENPDAAVGFRVFMEIIEQ